MKRSDQGVMEREIGVDQSGGCSVAAYGEKAAETAAHWDALWCKENTHADNNRIGFMEGEQPCAIRIANDLATREASYRLMYDIYEAKGWANDPSRMWFSLYELLPETVTLVVTQEETVVATLTIVFDSPFGLPDEETYPEEIAFQRQLGRKPSQIISLGVKDGLRGSRPVLARLFDFAYLVARYIRGSTHFLHTVLPHHVAFYEHQFLFEKLGGIKWQKKTGVDVQMMQIPLDTPDHLTESTRRRTFYRYFFARPDEPQVLEILRDSIIPISETEFTYFLGKKPQLLSKATTRQIEFLMTRLSNVHCADFRNASVLAVRQPTADRKETRSAQIPMLQSVVYPVSCQ